MKQVGILGGTFDPIHNGHVKLAEHAKAQFDLDEVWLMPSPNPPHKTNNDVSDFNDRYSMVQLALSDIKGLICSDYENNREGLSYTADTLVALNNDYPDHRFYFIMGADSLFEILKWYKPEVIMKSATLAVAYRDYDNAFESIDSYANMLRIKYNADIKMIKAQEIDISSQRLRNYIKSGKSISKYVNPLVEQYIHSHNLYI